MKTADITNKIETYRTARAYGRIRLSPTTVETIRENRVPKGNLIEATKLAGIYGAKKTGELLPFCHPIPLDFVKVELQVEEDSIEATSEVRGIARTGYEMEALTAVSVALLNIYDMCKALDKGMVIEEIRLIDKSGGKSDWHSDLRGIVVKVIAEKEEIGSVAQNFLKELGATVGDKPRIEVYVGSRVEELKEFEGLDRVISIYDFKRHTLRVKEPIRVGLGKEGKLIIELPEDVDRIEFFFKTFGGLLRGLL
jgi:cyclic pyranopterin phosphate synthase